jgi:protein SCO1
MPDICLQAPRSTTRRAPLLLLCRAALLASLLLFVHGEAPGVEKTPGPVPSAAAGKAEDTTVGVIERLGFKIPLDVTFRDEAGKQVRLAELVTGPTIILPVYYSCTNVCYNLQWGLAQVLPKIKSRAGEEYRVLSVSFDEHDSPQLAATFKRVYLASMHAPFPQDGWRFLTGDAANIQRFTQAVGYGFQRRGRDFLHPVASLIVARDGTIVRYLYGSSFLPKDLALALIEARDGTSGTTIRKMMEYCFTFDPGQKTYVFNILRVSATVVILCTAGFLAFLVFGGKRLGRKKE